MFNDRCSEEISSADFLFRFVNLIFFKLKCNKPWKDDINTVPRGLAFLHECEGVAGVEVGDVGVDHNGHQARRGQRLALHRPEPGTGDC